MVNGKDHEPITVTCPHFSSSDVLTVQQGNGVPSPFIEAQFI